MKITEKNFIELLRKSDSFVMQEAFSKVKNAKPVAVFEEDKALVLQDKTKNRFFYAQYELKEGFVNLSNIKSFDFEEADYKEIIKENAQKVFSKESDTAVNNLKKSIKDIITESATTSDKLSIKIQELLKEEHVTYVEKAKYQVKDLEVVNKALASLKENEYFTKFIAEAEKKKLTPLILEEINWEKETGKLYQSKYNYDKKETLVENNKQYSLKGFKKAQLIAKGYWKDEGFRKRLKECIEDNEKIKPFIERYKNMSLLGEEILKEDISKALLAVNESNKISEHLETIMKAIKENYENMLTWDKLNLQEGIPGGEAAPGAPEAAVGGDPMAAAAGEEAPPGSPEAEAGIEPTLPEEPTEATEALGDEEQMATEASGEVAIINSLLSTIEEIFWNGNQENKELANLIKELRDMRESGEFDEQRLEEIFKDLFAVTQQVETAEGEEEVGEEEIEAGEEAITGEEVGAGEEVAAEEGAETPLETY